jgi:hypothetical protein
MTLCIPASLQDIFIFVMVNYVTHAMTVKCLPGELPSAALTYNFTAFLLPFTGAWRGLRAVKLAANLEKDEVQRACRAGALCAVARSATWKPWIGENVGGCIVRGSPQMNRVENVSKARVFVDAGDIFNHTVIRPSELRIHGGCSLPPGYHLVRLPEDLQITSNFDHQLQVSSTSSAMKSLASVVQLIYATMTVYQAQGSQFERYGYASFSLTVIPYGIMSLINLIGNLLTPDYSSLYIARTDVLDEAEARGGKFEGVLRAIDASHGQTPKGDSMRYNVLFREQVDGMTFFETQGLDAQHLECGPSELAVPSTGFWVRRDSCTIMKVTRWLAYTLCAVAILGPYVIIAVITGFRAGSSTLSERLWTLAWLVMGQLAGTLMTALVNDVSDWCGRVWVLVTGAPFLIAPIGGLFTVCSMMREFGNCVDL